MIAQFLVDHPDVVAICYHTPWPGALDPLYLHNPVQNLARAEALRLLVEKHTIEVLEFNRNVEELLELLWKKHAHKDS